MRKLYGILLMIPLQVSEPKIDYIVYILDNNIRGTDQTYVLEPDLTCTVYTRKGLPINLTNCFNNHKGKTNE